MVLRGMAWVPYRSIGNQWPVTCQVCASFDDPTNARTIMGSPRYALSSGVPGSPWISDLNNLDGSGSFINRTLSGSTRMLYPLPVVASPPFKNHIGDLLILSGNLCDGGPSTDTGFIFACGLSAVINSAVRALLSMMRSEEHTSELQSLAYLVCRLLLEKKK